MSTFDIRGGAARAAYRLHRGLLSIGIDSIMLVHKKISNDDTVKILNSKLDYFFSGLRPVLNGIPLRFYKRNRLFTTSWLPSRGINKMIKEINPDLVHLHWVADDMLRIEELARIKKPLVWSLHDMWPFTGGCHIDEGCGKYRTECGKCPALVSNRENDLSRKVFRRKQNTYSKIAGLNVIGLSGWMQKKACDSKLFSGIRVFNIPNPIDMNAFNMIDRSYAKELLGIDKKKKLIFFGAVNATSDHNKGFNILTDSCYYIKSLGVEFLVLDSRERDIQEISGITLRYLGYFHDDLSLKILYNAADLTVVPSLYENLSNVIMESLACGTPVVAFNIGGNEDLISHKQNGYLAEPYDPVDLARGIDWVLSHPEPQKLSSEAIQKVENCFEMQKVANQYRSLYENILRND